jgi:electron transport complex protein RnfB
MMMIFTALLVFSVMGGLFGLVLGVAAIRFKVQGDPLVEKIDAVLPQTQCGQCGFAGCRPYATAMANDAADINRCPPGGEATIVALADLLGKPVKTLDANNGVAKPKTVAVIDEAECIGCTKCIQACPVDAIVGAAKHMHTVIRDLCSGCDLCVPPCPVDCIDMVAVLPTLETWSYPRPQLVNRELQHVVEMVVKREIQRWCASTADESDVDATAIA